MVGFFLDCENITISRISGEGLREEDDGGKENDTFAL